MAGGSPDLSQARTRIHPTLAPAPGSRGQQVEHTCERRGALTYLAALDIGRRRGRAPRVFGRSETKGGIEPFDRLVWQVMTREPYASARRVFWIVDNNGSAHRGQRSIDRLEGRWPNLVLVHLPTHASWLNQVEIYFSIIQRKVLEPNEFESTTEVARTLNAFECRWNEAASRSSGTSRAMTSPGSWTALPRRSPGFGLPMIASQALSPSGGRRR
jgi:hypothetical protein